MAHFEDDLFLGAAPGPQAGVLGRDGGSPADHGVGPLGRIFVYDIVPAALAATVVCAAQVAAAAGPLLINGTGAVNGVATLDVPRSLRIVSANAADTTQTITVTGTDYLGQVMTEARTLNGTTAVNFLKAFRTVTRVVSSAVTAGAVSVGTNDVFGLPYRMLDAGYLVRVGWANTLADNAATFVPAVTTAPNTSALGDVRGTISPSSAANGANRLVVVLALSAIAAGPNATQIGAIGVAPSTT